MTHTYDPDNIHGKLVFIVNPFSGNGRGRKVWKRIETILARDHIPHAVHMTARSKAAIGLASRLASCKPLAIIAVGGDGTLSEVAQGLANKGSKCPLAFIPAGSGNDFAREIGIRSDPEAAISQLLAAVRETAAGSLPLTSIDLLRHGDRWAVNNLGAGLDGFVTKLANEAKYKNWLNRMGLGSLVYPLTLLLALFTYRPVTATVTVDGIEMTFPKLWFCAITNISYFGGGMRIAPHARPDDGYADICIVSGISRIGLLLAFPRVYKGTHTNHKAVSFFRGINIRIQSDKPLAMQAEGEYVGQTPTAVELVPGRLNITRPIGPPPLQR